MTALVVGAALVRDGRVLAARRSRGADAGGWEFPGGKVEPGESPEQAVVREIGEELGCTVEVVGWLDPVVAIGPGLELRVAVVALIEGEPTASAGNHDELRWLSPAGLGTVSWLAADEPFVVELTANGVPGAD